LHSFTAHLTLQVWLL